MTADSQQWENLDKAAATFGMYKYMLPLDRGIYLLLKIYL
jgi:hypothetical protein